MRGSVWRLRLALPQLLMRSLVVLLLWLVLSVGASAKDTGYVFVSHERTNNIAVIDPKQDYRIIKWIATSRRPRGMKFRYHGKQLLVSCGGDEVIYVIDVPAPPFHDHIATRAWPQIFQLNDDLYR